MNSPDNKRTPALEQRIAKAFAATMFFPPDTAYCDMRWFYNGYWLMWDELMESLPHDKALAPTEED